MSTAIKLFKTEHPRGYGLTRIAAIGLGRGFKAVITAAAVGVITAFIAWFVSACIVGLVHEGGEVADSTIDRIVMGGVLAGILASGIALCLVVNAMWQQSISGTDRRSRREAARVIVAQAVAARDYDAAGFGIELGLASGGQLHAGWLGSAEIGSWHMSQIPVAEGQLCIEFADMLSMNQHPRWGFASPSAVTVDEAGHLDRVTRLASRVVALHSMHHDPVYSPDNPGLHEVISTRFDYVASLFDARYPVRARRRVEDELLKTGFMDKARFEQLLPEVLLDQPAKQAV